MYIFAWVKRLFRPESLITKIRAYGEAWARRMSMANRPRGPPQGGGVFLTEGGGGGAGGGAGAANESQKQAIDITFVAVSSSSMPPVVPPSGPVAYVVRPSNSLDLMTVPKKVPPARKGWRASKSIKAAPVVIKCKGCGRIKLPQFYCCGAPKLKSIEG